MVMHYGEVWRSQTVVRRRHKIRGSLGVCVSCEAQRACQEGIFFNLTMDGLGTNLCKYELSMGTQRTRS